MLKRKKTTRHFHTCFGVFKLQCELSANHIVDFVCDVTKAPITLRGGIAPPNMNNGAVLAVSISR